MAVGFFSTKDAGEFALGLTQNSRISQVAFQFFGWVIVMAFTFIFSLISSGLIPRRSRRTIEK